MPQTIAYLVHNLADPAVLRRVRMFHAGGANVIVIGFWRGNKAPGSIDGAPVVALGHTADGRFGQRILAVLKNIIVGKRLRKAIAGADVLVARNLEMLVLAVKVRQRRRLVYECLDIHRLLLQDTVSAKVIQRIERLTLARTDLIITSSPRFETEYFRTRRALPTPIRLIENKVLKLESSEKVLKAHGHTIACDGPWVIGWFGMLRCRRSLAILSDLAAQSNGAVEILIAGIPSEAEFPEFDKSISGLPGIRFTGRYRASDLAALYGQVHFAWAVDYFEEGLNSAWLLPNRLYEALDNGVVPICLSSVETGNWLARHRVGIGFTDPEHELAGYLRQLGPAQYRQLTASIEAMPRSLLETTSAECAELVGAVAGTA